MTLIINAQQLNGEFGVGLGWTFNSDDGPLPDDAIRAPLRIIFQTGLNYRFNEKISLGVELSTSVFQRINIFSYDIGGRLEDGTEVLDPRRTYSSIIGLKPTYTFEHKGFTPYVAMGVGYNFHVNRTNFNNEGEVNRQTTKNFSIIPEVGLGIGDFFVSIKSVIGGRMNGFDQTDSEGVRTILAENRYLLFYVTGNYRFTISKK